MANTRTVEAVLAETEAQERERKYVEKVKAPPTTIVVLPGGLEDPLTGERIREAEVRELNGYDEEAIQRQKARDDNRTGDTLVHILDRCVTRIGAEKPEMSLLNVLYTGDWDALLLGIRIASFGHKIEWGYTCKKCSQRSVVEVDLSVEVQVRSPDTFTFEYEGRRDRYVCGYPRGGITRSLVTKKAPSPAQVVSETLYGSLLSINGKDIESMDQIRRMPTADRDEIMNTILNGMPSVLLGEVTKACSECDEQGEIGLNLAALFQGRMAGI